MNHLLASSLIYTSSSNPYYDINFRQMLDPHLQWLKTHGNVQHDVIIPQTHMGAFIGDFYAALQVLEIDAKYHRIIMLANGLTNPIYYRGQFDRIIVPDKGMMDRLLMIYNTGKANLLIGVPGD